MHGMTRAFLASVHESYRVRDCDMPMSAPSARACPRRGHALVPARDVYMSPLGTKHRFSSPRRIYLRKYVKIFAEKRTHISRNTRTYLRK